MKRLILFLLFLAAIPLAAQEPDSTQVNPRKVADAIIKEAGRHLGKPYLYGGNGPQSFDCTGFTCYVFNKFGYKLSRSSADQAHDGREVRGGYDKYQKGDIIIFGGRNSKKTWVSSSRRTAWRRVSPSYTRAVRV